ncbi:MAG: hypothetical protein AAF719_12205 [Pseudomonadota bacterium]
MTDPNLPAVFEEQAQSETDQIPPDGGLRPKSSLILGVIFVYCALQWAMRLLGSPVFMDEAAEHLLAAQSIELGYHIGRPPLASWTYALTDAASGLSKPVFFGVKYGMMAIGAAAFYFAARIIFTSPSANPNEPDTREDLAAAATGAWTLTLHAGWLMHGDVIAPVFSFALLSMTLHAFVAAAALGKTRDWAYFGAAAGIGGLASYWHPVLVIALFVAGRSIHAMRPALALSRIAYASFIGLLLLAPLGYWLSSQDVLGGLLNAFTPTPWHAIGDTIQSFVQGAARLVLGNLALILLPLLIIWMLVFWPLWFPFIYPFFPHRWLKENATHRAWRSLAARATGVGLLISVVLILARLTPLPGEALMAAFLPLPFWMFQHVRRASPFPIAMRSFLMIVIAAMIVSSAARALAWRQGPEPGCHTEQCDAYLPTSEWADALTASGFRSGTLVAADPLLSGNLRRSMPQARVLDAAYPIDMFPDAGETVRACLAVWRDTPSMPDELIDYLNATLEVRVFDRAPGGALRRTYLLSESEAATLYYRFLQPSEACR